MECMTSLRLDLAFDMIEAKYPVVRTKENLTLSEASMAKIGQVKKAVSLIKLFTHASAVIVLLIYNDLRDVPLLISLVLAVLFASYLRQFYLVAYSKAEKYKWISTVTELALIIGIGFIDKSGGHILLFFACLSEAIIYYDFGYSGIILAVPYFLSVYFINTLNKSFKNVTDLVLNILINYAVSIAFVAGTSYYVRSQIREKEKLARVNQELEEAYKNLIDASAASEQLSIEKERTRMAREIHDTLAHTLTTLIIQLEACKKLSSVNPGRLAEELEKAQELTRSGLNDVKRTIKALRPQVLEEKPFFESVLDFINNTMCNTEVHIILDNRFPQELKLSTAHEITIFRLIQESITNSIRHGHAAEVQIKLALEAGTIRIGIRDNGAGCTRVKKGFGLNGIQERLESAGGTVDFSSTAGNGFETKASIPLQNEEADV